MTAERNLLQPRRGRLEEAEDLDLLILGSQGYGPVGALLGSVSARLMKMAPCAVLVFPRGSGADPWPPRAQPIGRQAHRASRRQALGVRLRPGSATMRKLLGNKGASPR